VYIKPASILLVLGVCLTGCAMITPRYTPGSMDWSKDGVGSDETHQFYRKCYKELLDLEFTDSEPEIQGQEYRDLVVGSEIRAQKCMLEHGFSFKDRQHYHNRLCSKSHARRFKTDYMDFPVCQKKHGRYKK